MDLNQIWFVLVGVLLTGYAILDGFDLGVGTLHLFSRGDVERRTLLNSIGPVWDGNEVWLVTGGGALFAAFPHAYATAFSGFYIAFMLVLAALIFRAVAIEFRSKEPWAWWRGAWDVAFCVASVLASLLFGVAIGNMIIGVPIGPDMEYRGTFAGLLNPYALLVGVFNVSLFANHGAIYLYMKTDGALQEKVRGWIFHTLGVFVTLYMLVTIVTLARVPSMLANFEHFPWLWSVAAAGVLAIANIPRELFYGRPMRAFLSSCAAMAALITLFGMGVYPNMIVSSLDPEWNLTIYNAASSPRTLGIMLVIACIGMPFVLGYTATIYWIFRGKVKLDKFSY
ncbi:MAG: cytochrome d ubiquinol oxidase subunit II [Candidatus Sumerlaeia bacterium]